MDAADDDQLLSRWQAGEAPAGEALVERYFARMYNFFHSKLGSEADELVQRTFLACLGAKDRFRGESSFRTFLYGIAKNQLYETLRAHQRANERFEPELSSIMEVVSTPRTKIARGQDYEHLVSVMRGLPVNQQTLLELHYWDDVSIAELAQIFEAPEVTIRSRLHRARLALRERLEAETPGTEHASSLDQMDQWARQLSRTRAV